MFCASIDVESDHLSGEIMTQIARQDFTENLLKLLKETFEGPPREGGSAYLDKGAGLFQTLDSLGSEAASHRLFPGAPTVAAHCAHAGYYVRVLHTFLLRREPEVDWPASWRTQRVEPEEWDALKAELRSDYEALMATLGSLEAWGDDEVGDSMAIVVHTAYHLGAIRQLVRVAQARG
jgi:hypothetical protein